MTLETGVHARFLVLINFQVINQDRSTVTERSFNNFSFHQIQHDLTYLPRGLSHISK